MKAKDRALELIRRKPGLAAKQIMEALGVKRGDALKLRELEKAGLIRWNDELNGWEAEK